MAALYVFVVLILPVSATRRIKLYLFTSSKDPFSGHLFVFFNRTGDKCKILFWDRTGFCVWYKRLEEGTFEKLMAPPGKTSLEVDISKLTWILEGIDLFKARRRKRYKRS